jgi:hypothetical protein
MLVTFVLSVLGFVLIQSSQGMTGVSLILILFYAITPAFFLALMVGAVIPDKSDHEPVLVVVPTEGDGEGPAH